MTREEIKSHTIVTLASAEEMALQLRQRRQLKGRQADETSLQEVQQLLGMASDVLKERRDLLIEHLHKLNDTHRGLHQRHLVALAKLMNMAMAEVYEVATFYHHFEVLQDGEQAPQFTVRVCDGLSCDMAGAATLLGKLQASLGADQVKVVAAPCMGRCEQAPVAVVHQHEIGHASVDQVMQAVQAKAIEAVVPDYIDFNAYVADGGYELLQALDKGTSDTEAVLKAMEDSGLRGLGGAGFPAGRKWRIVREQVAPRLMAVNIDEGEPGTFKDRTYLERDPHRFLEGMLVAAHVVGIDAIYIYLRDEYHGCRKILETELAKLQANAQVVLPKIELRRGAGAYICGEESAMIESIEGKRGEPRMRPPYIAQVGLFGRPTLEHNFETLYWVRDIVQKGPEWFSGYGRHDRKGLRSFSVSGRVKKPGVKLAPAGITIAELIEEYCGGMQEGHKFYAYLPGGASGGILPASLKDIPLDFDTLQAYGCFIGSAAVIVLGHQDSARHAALNMMNFFAHESCGQCTPCRVGTAKAVQLMQAPVWDATTLEDLNQVMSDASICGLGQAAPNPIRCVQKYFPQEII
ncbi:NADH-ubiquinone oxidoreductase-F iron-sulfur binding region domain-containing protein [Limnohabitans sp. 103DPR2]|uniref:NADH-ubiquinone oxidoreductase-F iron-sulfur binding region domain-containing protein n=1 Tax=Limnohabitans sp. 103DPR2 TaxID=1678129 RepID=UPI0006DCA255|nr:NADH-ubiquinone oxidoreductase-F iron-sulfur binding region domain-containing protein [Limnohabitans sp. 103DPR2]ALK91461.1 NADH-quinone oxidoreductase subunit F [Limnohabitans sp. 103DPR2]